MNYFRRLSLTTVSGVFNITAHNLTPLKRDHWLAADHSSRSWVKSCLTVGMRVVRWQLRHSRHCSSQSHKSFATSVLFMFFVCVLLFAVCLTNKDDCAREPCYRRQNRAMPLKISIRGVFSNGIAHAVPCHSTAFWLVFVYRLQWMKVISTRKNQSDYIFNADKYIT